MARFTIPLTWEVEEGKEYALIISGLYQPGCPTITNGPPDSWEQGEDAFIEDMTIGLDDGSLLPPETQEKLNDCRFFNDAVLTAVQEENQ